MLSSFFVQLNFAKKVVRVPCSGGGDINGNLIGLIGVQMLVVGLHAGIFFSFGRLFVFLCTCPGNIESENGGWLKDVDKVDLAEQSLLNKLIRRSLVRNRNQVEVQQRDPTSPLFSVKTFEELRL